MPLDRYGVLVGTLNRHHRDQPDTQGRWFHVNLEVDAPAGSYRCAIDVDSKQSQTGVQWKRLTLDASAPAPAAALAPGYHDLTRLPGSGALDYQRHPALAGAPGCVFVRRPPAWLGWLLALAGTGRSWTAGSNLQAAQALESMLVAGRRILVFGEPFTGGLGMHNVHQNQGDPAGSQWWQENGIWQDGGTLCERPDGRFDVFISKFSSQAYRTDAGGHPV
ncbi:DUF2278 family protein [Planobispora takensis]|uniref:DUF2278 domain-containing protein n=1 Tax=Planobispora takensis TaxID=1367882 RepID=A0A8J3T357_9ACTN|nr:DUF2278 family protein [Planobispora takensis]GII04873.1 hypothetical protein Pta02_68810 [Planobispora takensis]